MDGRRVAAHPSVIVDKLPPCRPSDFQNLQIFTTCFTPSLQLCTHTGPGGVLVPSQLLALPPRSSEVWEAAALNHLSSPTHDDTAALALQVDVPALGHAVYRVEAVVGSTAHDGASGSVAAGSDKTASSSSSHSSMQARQLHPQGDTTLSNGQLEVTVSPEKGGVTNVRVLSSQQQYAFSATLAHYQADKLFRRTGAYIFTMREQSEVRGWWLLLCVFGMCVWVGCDRAFVSLRKSWCSHPRNSPNHITPRHTTS